MLKRIITAVVAIAIFIPVCIFSETVIFAAAMSILSAVGTYEMVKCIGMHKYLRFSVLSYILSLVLPLIPYFMKGNVDAYYVILMSVITYLIIVMAVNVFSMGKIKFQDVSSLFTGVIYVSLMFTSISALRYSEQGKYIYLLAFIGAWVSDTFAYFCGMLFGKHKLIPLVSPKKTWEGSIGGIIFDAVGFIVYGIIIWKVYSLPSFPNLVPLAVAGALCSVVSQVGDLTASVIKRNYDIKDYGNIFPGHGGVMDRFDSVLMTSPVILIISQLSFISFFEF